MLSPLIPAFSNTEWILAETASHHSRGSCSDHCGFGVCNVCGDEATAITSPRSSIINALLEVVDVSMPRKYILSPIKHGQSSHTQKELHRQLIKPLIAQSA